MIEKISLFISSLNFLKISLDLTSDYVKIVAV